MGTSGHRERIKEELRAVGVTAYGLRKFATRYVHKIIHPEEHIKGVVYGRHATGESMLLLPGAMLIATEDRVVFLDHKPGFTNTKVIAYEVIAGIEHTTAGMFTTVCLHTRFGAYKISFVNSRCAQIFMRYIETRRMEAMVGYQTALGM
jgi:hypothetical protein